MRAVRFTAAAFLGLVSVTGLGAQTVVGTAVEAADERPVGGAFVLLVDDAGVERARALTTSRGTFRLEAERPGAYRLRLERIGLADAETDLFTVPAGETVNRRITAASVPIRLAAIRVEAGDGRIEPRCGAPTGDTGDLGRVWTEIEKALEATAWTVENSRYRYDVLSHRQAREPDGTPIASPEHRRQRIHGRHPFRAVPPASLLSHGWVREYDDRELAYYGPDAETLLADSFVRTHCFRLVRSDSADERIVGIGFEPIAGRDLPEISGVLWVERATAKLFSLEFRYLNLPIAVKSDRLGGTVEFDALPDGGWIVRSWEIRTPLTEVERRNFFGPRIRLTGVHHEGWQVLTVWRTGELTGTRDVVVRRYPAPEGAPAPGDAEKADVR